MSALLARLVSVRHYLSRARLARAGIAIAGFAVVSTMVAAPASASTPTPTQIVSMTVSPATISYPGPENVKVSGTLETTGPPSQPLAGQQVLLVYTLGLNEYPTTVTTGPDGHFTGTLLSVAAPTAVTANFYATDGYASASATVSLPPAQVYPAKIQLDPITPGPQYSYQTVTGTLLMQLPSGQWVPSPYAALGTTGALYFTGASGRFSTTEEVVPGNQVTISTVPGLAWSESATTGPFYMPLSPEPTWFCGPVGADFPVSPVAQIGFEIHLCYVTASGKTENYSGLARLYFRPASGGSWQFMASTHTAADGFAHVTVSGYLPGGQLAAGQWKWTAPGSAQFAGSASQPFGVVITVPTHIYGIRIVRRGRRAFLAGRLGYLRRGGPVAHARVLVERRAGRHWQRLAAVTTSSRGTFRYRLRGRLRRLHGRYRAIYRGGRLPGAQAPYGSFERVISRSVLFR